MRIVSICAAVAVVLFAAAPALADDQPAPAAAPDGGKLRDLCTDRPTKSTGTCTVDKGHWQIESDIVNVTSFRFDGITAQTTLVTSPVIKYGLSDNSDIELGFTPDEIVRVTDHNTGQSASLSGFGDMFLHWKYEFVGAGGGNFTATLDPYVKAPTARAGIGNGEWEGGLVVPVNWNSIGGGWSLGADPEVDDVHDALGSGYHLALQAPLTFSHPMGKNLTGSIEFWAGTDFDPVHTTHQYSADLAAAWVVGPNLQLDGGVNFGLNRDTPQVQGYIGISRRF
jgi:hypothetical protein